MATARKKPGAPTFEASLAGLEKGNYLGSSQLLDELVRGWVGEFMQASSPEEAMNACNRLALVFAGQDPNFTPVPDWNTRDGVGMEFAQRLGVDPDQNLLDILRTGLCMIGVELMGVAREFVDKPGEDWQWIVDAKIEMLRSLLLGTITLTHPDPAPEEDVGA